MEESLIQRWRSETPGCASRIHLNNAGAALMPAPVVQAIQEYLQLEAHIGGYEAARQQHSLLQGFYRALATLLHTDPAQIAFASNATDAFSRALSSIPFQPGDTLLTTRDDYVSNQLAFLQLARRQDIRIIHARNLEGGGVDLDDIQRILRQHTPRAVAVTHVPTNSGLVQPVEAIGALVRQTPAWYLVDACQSAGQMPLDVARIQCDFLSATFRKFLRGPRGAGFLYVSPRVLEAELAPLFVDLSSAHWTGADAYELLGDARRFEIWERPYALVLGAKTATEYALDVGLEAISRRVTALAQYTRDQLSALPSVRLLDQGPRLCGIVSLTIDNANAKRLYPFLLRRSINASMTYLEYARFDFEDKKADWALRLSPHYYNTTEEIDQAVEVLREFCR